MTKLYFYRIRSILRDRANLFWTLAFPFLLGTLFYLAFGSLATNLETFAAIPVAVVKTADNAPFDAMLEALSEGDEPILTLQEVPQAEAETLLEEEDVVGIIEAGAEPGVVFREKGMSQSILKGILDRYVQAEATLTAIARENPAALEAAMDALLEETWEIVPVELSSGSLNFMNQNFYALVAMTCLYGGFFGLTSVASLQPTQSPLGARRSVTPTHKGTLIVSDFLGALTVVFTEVCLLLLFLRFVFGIQLGANLPAILLLCLAGSASGVMLGILLGIVLRLPQGAKDGILIGLSLGLSFLGGLMYWNMRYIIERAAPLANRVNPVALMVDAFYALETYGVGGRYWMNIILLFAITLIMGIVCLVSLRRNQYASI